MCCCCSYSLSDKNSGGHHFLPAFVHTPLPSLARHHLCLPAIIWTLLLLFMFTDGAAATAAVITVPTCSHSYLQPFVFAHHHLHPPALVRVRRWSCCCCCGYCTHPLSFAFTAVCTHPPSSVLARHRLNPPTLVHVCRWSYCCCCGYRAHPLSFIFTTVCTCSPLFVITFHHLCLPAIVYLHLHQI